MSAIIYTKPSCDFCDRAKALLTANGYKYSEVEITEANRDTHVSYLEQISRRKIDTVPQIVINDRYIGGCDDLEKLLPNK